MYKAYYVICVTSYEIEGTIFNKGDIEWKPKECRPIVNDDWRRAKKEEVDTWLNKTNSFDMRKTL